ncbi:uncharacterized protein LOC143431171 [Xylocopa sonorina]|uniref:uncharacterized protein LOC143431171 n=1 Tax=Xylocopa sonorina TaxID=1818115 RepID=UPI00403A902D
MCDTKETITLLTAKSQTNSKNNNDLIEIKEEKESTQKIENGRKSPIFHSISLIVLHILDSILLIILLPFIIWQWVAANDQLKIILKAVVEVAMELVMWIIFAGVSIFMTTTFVLEDVYFRKNDSEKLEQLLATGNGASSSNNKMPNDYNKQDKMTASESKD